MSKPTVLTVILNFRTPEMTLRALDAAHAAMKGVEGGIVVVDNGSDDGSTDLIAEHIETRGWGEGARVRLCLAGCNGGFGAGMNHGIMQGLPDGARPDYIYLLNSDAFPEPDAIRRLVDHLEDCPTAGIAGSHIRGEDDVTHQTAFRFPTIAGEFEGAARTGVFTRLLHKSVVPLPIPQRSQPVEWCAGASMILRQEMLDEVGNFDEGFFLYFEETDLCHRARRAGWETWYLPCSRVVHVGSVSTGMKTWARTPRYWFDSRWRYFTKTHGRIYAALATGFRILGETFWRLRAVLTGREIGGAPRFLRDLVAYSAGLHASDGGKCRAAQPNSIAGDVK